MGSAHAAPPWRARWQVRPLVLEALSLARAPGTPAQHPAETLADGAHRQRRPPRGLTGEERSGRMLAVVDNGPWGWWGGCITTFII